MFQSRSLAVQVPTVILLLGSFILTSVAHYHMVGMPELHPNGTAVTGTLNTTTTTVNGVTTTTGDGTVMSCMEDLADANSNADMTLAVTAFFVAAVLAWELVRGVVSRAGEASKHSNRGYFQGNIAFTPNRFEDFVGMVMHVPAFVLLIVTHSYIEDTATDSQCNNRHEATYYLAAIFLQFAAIVLQFLPLINNSAGTLLDNNGQGTQFSGIIDNLQTETSYWRVIVRACAGVILIVISLHVTMKSFEKGDVCPHSVAAGVYFNYGVLNLLAGLMAFGIGVTYVNPQNPFSKPRLVAAGAGFLVLITHTIFLAAEEMQQCSQISDASTLDWLIEGALLFWMGAIALDLLTKKTQRAQVAAVNREGDGGRLRRSTDMASMRLTTDKGTANNAKSLQFV